MLCGSGACSEAGDGSILLKERKCILVIYGSGNCILSSGQKSNVSSDANVCRECVRGRVVKSFYKKSKARVRDCEEEGMSFNVIVRLRQRGVMSSWLFVYESGYKKMVGKNYKCRCLLDCRKWYAVLSEQYATCG